MSLFPSNLPSNTGLSPAGPSTPVRRLAQRLLGPFQAALGTPTRINHPIDLVLSLRLPGEPDLSESISQALLLKEQALPVLLAIVQSLMDTTCPAKMIGRAVYKREIAILYRHDPPLKNSYILQAHQDLDTAFSLTQTSNKELQTALFSVLINQYRDLQVHFDPYFSCETYNANTAQKKLLECQQALSPKKQRVFLLFTGAITLLIFSLSIAKYLRRSRIKKLY
jgi:hypothetical protein